MIKVTTDPSRKHDYFYSDFSLHRKYNRYYPYEKILSYYSLFLTIIGTVCNLTSFFIMHHKNMRKHSCMRILAILALSDLIVLYQWNFNQFFEYNLSQPPFFRDLEELSLFGCRWISYLAFSSLQLSAWLLSLVSVDRLMVIYSNWWKNTMRNPSKINVTLIFIFFFFSSNHHNFTV